MRLWTPGATAHKTARAVRCWASKTVSVNGHRFDAQRLLSNVISKPQALTWEELYFSSRLARLSGYCYYPADELKELVKAEGLELVSMGRTPYTSWYVADGCMDNDAFYHAASKQFPWAGVVEPQHGGQHGGQQHHRKHHNNRSQHQPHGQHQPHEQPHHVNDQGQSDSQGHAGALEGSTASGARRMRFVCVRGVQWGAPDADFSAISSALMNFWPTPLMPPLPTTAPTPPLVSHSGVTLLATDLFKQLAPYLTLPGAQANTSTLQPTNSSTTTTTTTSVPLEVQEEVSSQLPPDELCIAGHSLGGALGMLVLAQAIMAGLRPPTTMSCYTFGSPPVLAHRDGGGGHRVLQVLGLNDSSVRSFVLEHDPVPRALLTADPAFRTLKQYGPAKQLLDVRSWWSSGPGSVINDLMGQNPDMPPPSAPKSAWDIGAMVQQLQETFQRQRVVVPMFSADRFVYENVGSVYLMMGGADLVPIGSATEVDELLRMAIADLVAQPTRAIQAWLDHHHKSYAHDLETSALAQLKRQLRRAYLQRQQQQSQSSQQQIQTQVMHQHQQRVPANQAASQHEHQHPHVQQARGGLPASGKHAAHPAEHQIVNKSDVGKPHRRSRENESKV